MAFPPRPDRLDGLFLSPKMRQWRHGLSRIAADNTFFQGGTHAALQVLNRGMLSRIVRLEFTPVEMLLMAAIIGLLAAMGIAMPIQ
jgi:hypothetical protein